VSREEEDRLHGGKIASDDLPRDPDWDDVPTDLKILAGLDKPVIVVEPDGVSRDTLVIVPGLFAHARRLEDGDLE
jgi:hypothetical protein